MSTLADLRRRNMDEQREEPHEDRTDSRTYGDTEIRESVRKDARKALRTQASTSVSTGASTPLRALGRAGASTQGSKGEVPPPPVDDLASRVRLALQEKRTHPGGVKATVDMSADLSLRAKRFSLDHGNVPVRQMLIELLDAFLTGEGY